MHGSVMDFCRGMVQRARAAKIPMGRVLDVGSFDMNGSTRDLFPGSDYFGLDIHDGPGVDWVGAAHEFPGKGWDGRLFDVLVSTEALEHDPHWEKTLRACCALVKPGGMVMFTCATDKREPHALHLWPNGYYGNLSADQLRPVLAKVAVEGSFAVVRGNEDLQFFGRRGGAMECLEGEGLTYATRELEGHVLRELLATVPEGLARLGREEQLPLATTWARQATIRGADTTYDKAAHEVLLTLATFRLLGRLAS